MSLEHTVEQLDLARNAIHTIRNAFLMVTTEDDIEQEARVVFAEMTNSLTGWMASLHDLSLDYRLKEVYLYRGVTTDLKCTECGAELIERPSHKDLVCSACGLEHKARKG